MLKRSLDVENKENEYEQSFDLKIKRAKIIDVQQPESSSDDEEEEEVQGSWPIGSVIGENDGTVHPTNKQYFIYENTEPNMISKTARFWARKYLKVLQHVDPDGYDMYIHNDFVSYGELEVIENCFIDLAKGVFIKHKNHMNNSNYILAFRRLEALTIVLDYCNNFAGIDDGNRFYEILRLIGACYVTILYGLLPKSMLFDTKELNDEDMRSLNKISQQLPNFKDIIKRGLILGKMLLTIGNIPTGYTNILQTVYCNWSLFVDKIPINLNEKCNKKDEDIWEALKHASGIKKNAYRESFDFMKELNLYSKNHPGLGGNSHDLRKWSKAQRNKYSFDNIDPDNVDEDSFWFRL